MNFSFFRFSTFLTLLLVCANVNSETDKPEPASSATLSEELPCEKEIDYCVGVVIAETISFVEKCGELYPKSKEKLDSALKNWSVLKLRIPGLEKEALNPNSELRVAFKEAVSQYLTRIPSHEREIECFGRYDVIMNPEPMLVGDSVQLPKNALKKYQN